MLAIPVNIGYNYSCCGMIAVKREVAAYIWQVFRGANVKLGNWRQVTVSHSLHSRNNVWSFLKKHTEECTVTACRTHLEREKEATFFMASQVMRITLKAYDHELIDASAKKIIETVKKNGSQVSGPVPLPTKKEVVTILRAVHKYKDSREQFEQRTHKRLIDVITPTQKTVDALSRLEMPAGVYIDIKMKDRK